MTHFPQLTLTLSEARYIVDLPTEAFTAPVRVPVHALLDALNDAQMRVADGAPDGFLLIHITPDDARE